MQFDVVLTNPPFQDLEKRNSTPHKLWIDFTVRTFDQLLSDGGLLCQVSPASFGSPSNKVLELMKQHRTTRLRFDTGDHFPHIASTFADYQIYRDSNTGEATEVTINGESSTFEVDESVLYLPNDLSDASLAIHRKVIFDSETKLDVRKDYVTCHNINLRRSDTLSKSRTGRHTYPVFHTNRQTWYSSIRQPWADLPKVMWTRSGYTKPFFDAGEMGGTDMVYYVPVNGADEGEVLATALNLRLFQYIFKTAKWSGFGNEKVFAALPLLPVDELFDDDGLFDYFQLDPKEVDHVVRTVG